VGEHPLACEDADMRHPAAIERVKEDEIAAAQLGLFDLPARAKLGAAAAWQLDVERLAKDRARKTGAVDAASRQPAESIRRAEPTLDHALELLLPTAIDRHQRLTRKRRRDPIGSTLSLLFGGDLLLLRKPVTAA
jgi:hypothetical protein